MKSLRKSKKYAVKVDRLTFGYLKTQACFSSANFELGENEKAVLLSGSHMGKSTLIRILAGLEPEYIGRIELLGYCSSSLKMAYRNVVFLPERPVLLENKSVKDNIGYGMKVLYENSANIDYLLNVPYSLEKISNLKAKKLSVVERTMLEIERAKLKSIKLLLIDRSLSDIKAEIRARREDENEVLPKLKTMYSELIENSASAIIACETKEEIEFYGAKNFTVLYVYLGKIYKFKNLEDFEKNIIELDGLEYAMGYKKKLMKLVFSGGNYYFYETRAQSKKEFQNLVSENIKKRKMLDKNKKKYLQNVTFNKENAKIKDVYTRKIDLQKYPKLLDIIISKNLEMEEFFVIATKDSNNEKSITINSENMLLFVESTGEKILPNSSN